jgi:PAS domain S-box-containing protein
MCEVEMSNPKNKHSILAELEGIRNKICELEQSLLNNNLDKIDSIKVIEQDATARFVTQNGIIQTVNKQMREITGYPEDELLGISPLTIILPEDRTSIEKLIADTNGSQSPSVQEFRILTKGASTRWVIAKISAFKNNGSQQMVANLIDITDHKKEERSQKRLSDRYYDLCENITDMVLCTTPAGQTIYANKAWCSLLGYSPEMIGKLSVFEFLPQDYREHYRGLIQRAVSGENLSNISTLLLDNHGKRIPFEGSINCKFVDSKPEYLRITLHDVTTRNKEQQQAEAMLAEAQELNRKLQSTNRELEDFAHIASHDLQEPLRKISSFGDLLKESLDETLDDDDRENLNFMIDGAKRMQVTINDLLTYSRITTRAQPFTSVDPNKVIDDLRKVELANVIEEAKGRVVVPQPLAIIGGDPSQIYQLFQNLLLNAFKFRREKIIPTVKITSTPVQNGRIKFYVQDNGIGIDPEYHQQIFTMFKRLHSREQYKGTGIGLAICKKIIIRHDGEIGVDSKEGDGSTFWFTLPRAESSVANINIKDSS